MIHFLRSHPLLSTFTALGWAVILTMCAGCGSWTVRDCYVNGPCVVKATQEEVQKHCFTPGMRDDHGNEIASKARIEACFDRNTNEMWIPWSHLTDIYHELCHYFCGLKETPTCDRDCDLHNEDDSKGRYQ